jgi:small subunit ribosomal protein S6e
MNFKLVVSDPKSKKAYQKEIEQAASGIVGKKIGDKVPGNIIGLTGYELEITGGSDKEGFPMRKDVGGSSRKRILLASPPGFRPKARGQRKRKAVRGNTVSAGTSQVNMKIVIYGKEAVDKLLGSKEKRKEEPRKEAKVDEKKPEEKAETKDEARKDGKEAASKGKKTKQESTEEATAKAEEKMGIKDLEKSESEAKGKK